MDWNILRYLAACVAFGAAAFVYWKRPGGDAALIAVLLIMAGCSVGEK